MISTMQLGMGLVGLRKALRDRTEYDLGFTRGSPETMKRDPWIIATNLSAQRTCRRLGGCSSPKRWQLSY